MASATNKWGDNLIILLFFTTGNNNGTIKYIIARVPTYQPPGATVLLQKGRNPLSIIKLKVIDIGDKSVKNGADRLKCIITNEIIK